MKVLRVIDDFLNGITMYRLLMYGLGILAVFALGLSAAGQLAYDFVPMLISLVVLVMVCWFSNELLAKFWGALTNSESAVITALILFLILPAAYDLRHAATVVVAALAAMASKYLLSLHYKHVFNPAAFGALTVGLLGLPTARWWVATPVMLTVVAIFGFLVLRKTRRFQMFFCFALVALAMMIVVGMRNDQAIVETLKTAFTSWPLVFFGTVMLIEPSTMPWRRHDQLVYAGLVGLVFASQTHFGPLSSTPQVALLIGNLYAFGVSPKYKLRLRLKSKTELAPHVYDFAFTPDRRPAFVPGQYMEWTLPVDNRTDGRGNRRTFTVASSPTEPELHIGVKFYEPSSTYKQKLLAMEPGALMVAGQMAGSFTLPEDVSRKLAFVAGGIGLTPFRSMLKYLLDKGEKRDIVLFYMISSKEEVVYKDVLADAEKQGVKVIKVLGSREPDPAWHGLTGFLTPEMLAEQSPDFKNRTFYISGPNAMVQNYKAMLRHSGVLHIKTDYFPGY